MKALILSALLFTSCGDGGGGCTCPKGDVWIPKMGDTSTGIVAMQVGWQCKNPETGSVSAPRCG